MGAAVLVVHGTITGPRVTIVASSVRVSASGVIHSDGYSEDTTGTNGHSRYGVSHGGKGLNQYMEP